MKEFTIGRNDAGQRLDRFVSKAAPLIPESLLQKTLRKKDIKINGRPAKGEARLAEGDTVRVYLPDDFFEAPREENAWRKITAPRLDIVYEDEHILLINKPSGMLSQKAKETDESLVEYLIDYLLDSGKLKKEELACFRPSVCNRLDRNTSGIVAAGRSLPGLQIMSEVIKDRSLGKYYVCVVRGIVKGEARTDGSRVSLQGREE